LRLFATTSEEADDVEEQRDEGREQDEGRGDVLVGLHGILDFVGLVENHRGHQDDHRDGEPGAERPAGKERDDDDTESADAADDDGDFQEGEIEARHEYHGRQRDHEGTGDHASGYKNLTRATIGDLGGVVDQRDEDQSLQEDVDAQTRILGETGGPIEGQRLGGGGAEPEEDHDAEDTPGADAGDGAHERLGDAGNEKAVEGESEGGERSGHEAVGATEEGRAVRGRGVSDDEGIRFHTLQF